MKILLLPFAWLYGIAIFIRNFLFDRGIISSRSFDLPVIAIGNLRVGGTGKTPLTLYIIDYLERHQKRAGMVSRGYGRKTSGLIHVTKDHKPEEVGDEPLLIKNAFPAHHVTVAENRVKGVLATIESDDAPDVIVLDDAMQHRKVLPGLLIMLTAFHKPYYDDHLLPAGRLREPAFEAYRADIIIVSKCPPKLDIHTRRSIRDTIRPMHHQKVFFSFEQWSGIKALWTKKTLGIETLKGEHVLLVTGVADDLTISTKLEEMGVHVKQMSFGDHHDYTQSDVMRICKLFNEMGQVEQKRILTTEKDAVKLRKWRENEKFAALPVFVLRHEVKFFPGDVEAFEARIDEFIRSFH